MSISFGKQAVIARNKELEARVAELESSCDRMAKERDIARGIAEESRARVAELDKIVEHSMMEVPGYDSDRSKAEQLPLEISLLRDESEKKLRHVTKTGQALSDKVAELEGLNKALQERHDLDTSTGGQLQRRCNELQAQLDRVSGVYRMLGFDESIPEKCAAALMDRLGRVTKLRPMSEAPKRGEWTYVVCRVQWDIDNSRWRNAQGLIVVVPRADGWLPVTAVPGV